MFAHQEKAIDFALSKLKYPWIHSVILFGSCARGEERFDSDVDLLVLTTECVDEEKKHDEILKVKSDIMFQPRECAEIDIKFYPLTAYQTQDTTFFNEIKKDGIPL